MTVDHSPKADLNKSSSTQLSAYISSGSALLYNFPPSVPSATITILQNVSFGSGYKNKLFLSGVIEEQLLTSYNFKESLLAQIGLPFNEILLALCVLRI